MKTISRNYDVELNEYDKVIINLKIKELTIIYKVE